MSRPSNVVPLRRPQRRGRPRSRGRLAEAVLGLGVLMIIASVALGIQGGHIEVGPDRIQGWLIGSDLRGSVTHVRDGDTIEVSGTPV